MALILEDPDVRVYHGGALETLQELEDGLVDAIVTSPPYLDARPEYPSPSLSEFAAIFRELRRVCSGTLLLNVGRLFRDGRERRWWEPLLERAEWEGWDHVDSVVWAKPNANPIVGPVVTNAHEFVFLLGELERFDPDSVRLEYARGSIERLNRRFVSSVSVKGDTADRNGSRRDAKRGMSIAATAAGARPQSVVSFPVGRLKGNPHPAPMSQELADYLVGLSGGTTILDPFAGSGTTALAARARGRRSILIERDPGYCGLIIERLAQQGIPG